MKKNNKKKILIFKIFISILLIYILFRFVDFRNVLDNIMRVEIAYIIIYLILNILSIIISSLKWAYVSGKLNIINNKFVYFKSYLIGIFLNNFFPSFIGGDAYRIMSTTNNKKTAKSMLISVTLDRITGLVSVLILSMIFGWIAIFLYDISELFKIIIYFLTVGIIILSLIIVFLSKFSVTNSWMMKKIIFFLELIKNIDFSIILKLFVYSLLFNFIGLFLSNYVLFLAFGEDIDIMKFLSVIFLISIVSSVPISIGNIGIKEWAYVTLFGFLGIDAGICISVVILSRILQMFVSLFAVPFYLTDKNKI